MRKGSQVGQQGAQARRNADFRLEVLRNFCAVFIHFHIAQFKVPICVNGEVGFARLEAVLLRDEGSRGIVVPDGLSWNVAYGNRDKLGRRYGGKL